MDNERHKNSKHHKPKQNGSSNETGIMITALILAVAIVKTIVVGLVILLRVIAQPCKRSVKSVPRAYTLYIVQFHAVSYDAHVGV